MVSAESDDAKVSRKQARAGWLLLLVFVLNGVLVATHLGEFWPFSIYPMFSRAKTTFHQAVVRELDPEDIERMAFPATPASELLGKPYAVKARGVDPVDLNKYVRLTDDWDEARRRGIVRMFAPGMGEETLLIVEVRGDIAERETLNFEATPSLVFNREQAHPVDVERSEQGDP